MLKKKAMRKILITTITIVIILMIYMMPSKSSNINSLNVNPTIEYKTTEIGYVYLLSDNDLLVKVNVLINSVEKTKDKAIEIINKLINNNAMPNGLKSIVPKKTKILDVSLEDDTLSINFSKDILNVDDKFKNKLIESISYSIFEIKEINNIKLYVNDEELSKYFDIPNVITREFGINKTYNIKSLKDIQKVVVYYINNIDNTNYLVPVTNYVNNSEDKIKIIIESLSSSYIYQPNLVSLLNSKTELINYEINDDTMLLNFNNSIFMGNDYILEEVVYTIGYSVFDNYDVDKIIFNVDNRTVKEFKK
ncbi:MAG: GerMN domain-containing protein [bacterium]|nr:GerMN domain-containing protein [bacterium]